MWLKMDCMRRRVVFSFSFSSLWSFSKTSLWCKMLRMEFFQDDAGDPGFPDLPGDLFEGDGGLLLLLGEDHHEPDELVLGQAAEEAHRADLPFSELFHDELEDGVVGEDELDSEPVEKDGALADLERGLVLGGGHVADPFEQQFGLLLKHVVVGLVELGELDDDV
jgi:hypothetical protein